MQTHPGFYVLLGKIRYWRLHYRVIFIHFVELISFSEGMFMEALPHHCLPCSSRVAVPAFPLEVPFCSRNFFGWKQKKELFFPNKNWPSAQQAIKSVRWARFVKRLTAAQQRSVFSSRCSASPLFLSSFIIGHFTKVRRFLFKFLKNKRRETIYFLVVALPCFDFSDGVVAWRHIPWWRRWRDASFHSSSSAWTLNFLFHN